MITAVPVPDHDDIVAVLLFESDAEMTEWLGNVSNLAALKKNYNPRFHRALLNKELRQITILKGKG